MSQFRYSRFFLYVMLLFVFALAACGGGGETEEAGDAASPAAVATETAVPTQPTDIPPTAETAVIQPAESLSASFADAPDRATTMTSANAKPTVAPFAGLGGKDDGDAASPAPAAVPTNTPQPTPVPQVGDTGVLIENNSSVTVCYIYIPPSTSDSWGDDLLGSAGTLEVGANVSIELAPGTYDIRLDDCYGKIIASGYGIEVSEGIFPLTASDAELPAAGDAPLTILNDLDAVVCYVFIGPSSSESWGSDWLGTGMVILPGINFNLNIPQGTMDFQATDCGFNVVSEVYGAEVTAEGGVWTLSGAQADTTSLELVNQSTATVCYVQISLTTATEWGDDWLGENNVIESGQSFIFQMPADTYDLRALDCNQEVISEQYGLEISGTTTVSIP